MEEKMTENKQLLFRDVSGFGTPVAVSGESTYRQGVVFLIAAATANVFPDREFIVQQRCSMFEKSPSYYCKFKNEPCSQS